MASVAPPSVSHGLVRSSANLNNLCDSKRLEMHTADPILDVFGNSIVKVILEACDDGAKIFSHGCRRTSESKSVPVVQNIHPGSSDSHTGEGLVSSSVSLNPIMAGGLAEEKQECNLDSSASTTTQSVAMAEIAVKDISHSDDSLHHKAPPTPLDARPKVFPISSYPSKSKSAARGKKKLRGCKEKVSEQANEIDCKDSCTKTKAKKVRTKSTKKWKAVNITEFGFDFSRVSRLHFENDVTESDEERTHDREVDPSSSDGLSEGVQSSLSNHCEERLEPSNSESGHGSDGVSRCDDADFFLSLGIDVFDNGDESDCDPILDWDGIALDKRDAKVGANSRHPLKNSEKRGTTSVSKKEGKPVPSSNSHSTAKDKQTNVVPKHPPVLSRGSNIIKKCDKYSFYELECSSKKKVYIRRDRHRRVEKAHKAVKSKNCLSLFNNRGRKTLYMHHRLIKRHNLSLDFRFCQKQGRVPPMPKSSMDSGAVKEVFKVNRNNGGFGNPGRRHGAPPAQNLRHTLHETNAPNHLTMDLASFLISLQHREMTPEDYDMLLRLDDTVKPKTVSKSVLEDLKTDTVGPDGVANDADILCTICMEPYMPGDRRKFLPCGHIFHAGCVDTWLKNSSMNCPLDGLPVETS